MNDLKKKTASGFVYKFAERAGAQGISFIVQIVLARILSRGEYGLIALVTVFITVCDVFVTYGFGNSLIANKDSDQTDFSTCFYFGLVLSGILYGVLYFSSPALAAHYESELLCPVLRVMGLRLPIAAVNSVQHAYVSKHMKFRLFFISTSIGTVISGVLAIIMALNGFGIWALVVQYLGNVIMDTVCLWIIVGWRPTLEFSWTKLKAIYSYGWKILVVGLIDSIYSRLRNLVIGDKYSKDDLGCYDRGYKFPSFGMRLIEPTVNTVLFPALSQSKNDKEQMRDITRRITQISTYIISPIMIGMAVVAEPLVVLILTKKWLPCVIYLQIGCIANLFRPQQFINNSVIKASGNSGLLLKLDIVKKGIGIILLVISMQFGVKAIAWSLVAVYFLSAVINIAPNRKILGYGYVMQFGDVLKNMIPAVIMGVCIYPVTFLHLRPILSLAIQVPAAVAIYVLLSIITKNESFHYLLAYIKRLINGRNKHHSDELTVENDELRLDK